MDWEWVICGGCAGTAALRAVLDRETAPVHVVECLSVCTAPVTLAAQGRGRATYVFAGITAEDAADIAAFARAYEAAPAGWIEDARPLGRLRFCLKTRVPAMVG